jgi:hypothetical protein
MDLIDMISPEESGLIISLKHIEIAIDLRNVGTINTLNGVII